MGNSICRSRKRPRVRSVNFRSIFWVARVEALHRTWHDVFDSRECDAVCHEKVLALARRYTREGGWRFAQRLAKGVWK